MPNLLERKVQASKFRNSLANKVAVMEEHGSEKQKKNSEPLEMNSTILMHDTSYAYLRVSKGWVIVKIAKTVFRLAWGQ